MNAKPSAGIEPVVSRNEFFTAFSKALRLSVGRDCRYSYKEAQRKSGVNERMIEAYRYEPGHPEHRPAPIEDIISLSRALGPEFTADWLGLANQGAFWLPEPDEGPLTRAAVDAVHDAAELSEIAERGGSNVTELRGLASRMMVRGATLRAATLREQPDLFGRRVA